MAARDTFGYTPHGRLRRLGLTGREAEVLLLVVDRYRNAEIAAQLGISKRTVESHIAALLRKLGAADRADLMRIGRAYVGEQPRRHGDPAARSGRLTAAVAAGTGLRRVAAQLREQSARRRAHSAEQLDRSRELLASAQILADVIVKSRARLPSAPRTQS